MSGPEVEGRVRAICEALPGVEECQSHGAPAFLPGRRFVTPRTGGHHDLAFPHL